MAAEKDDGVWESAMTTGDSDLLVGRGVDELMAVFLPKSC